MDSQRERTLLLIKPDAVRRGLVGEILMRVERAGLALVAIDLAIDLRQASEEFVAGHYVTTEAQLAQMGGKLVAGLTEAGLDVAYEFGTEDPVTLGRLIHEWNVKYLASGPAAAVAIDGYHAVQKVRSLCGPTMPVRAEPGTIRGDYSSASSLVASGKRAAVRNLVHASDSALDPSERDREIEY